MTEWACWFPLVLRTLFCTTHAVPLSTQGCLTFCCLFSLQSSVPYAVKAWQSHPTASAGCSLQGSNERPTVVDDLWSLHTAQYMLYFACHAEVVRLTEHF
uniref:Secreted protein n=1 Tax=Eutreptiella gymnastica TaxID=73025 RepID=A0A7S4CYB9_9EUGL